MLMVNADDSGPFAVVHPGPEIINATSSASFVISNISFACNGHEDYLTNGGCSNTTINNQKECRPVRVQCYRSE